MDVLCRVCIKKAAKCTSLNTKIDNSSNQSFVDFLNKCTSINACQSDKLPQSLCTICARIIRTFYAFVKLAEKSDLTLREALKNSIATEGFNDSKEFTCDEITIQNEKIEEVPEDFNKEDSFHCETSSTNATGSSLYILDLVKEEPVIFESTSVFDQINESDGIHANIDKLGGRIEKPEDTLTRMDDHLGSIDSERGESEVDVSISLLKRGLDTNKETDSQKIKLAYEDDIKIGHGCRNQVSNEAAADSFTEHSDNSYKCEECNIGFNDKEELETHNLNHNYECNICGKKFSSKQYLQYHLPIHEQNKKYKCSICGKGFIRSSCRRSHMGIHSVEKPFECQICNKKFKAKSYLKRHMGIHSGIVKKCSQCDKEFKNSDSLWNHMKWHKNPKPFKCENCGKPLAKKCTYTRHMEICKLVSTFNDETHRKGHTKNTCVECNIVFIDKEEFKAHCINHICGDKHECNICGKKFAKRKYLNNHLIIHEGKKKYKCSICGKGFKLPSNRQAHMRIHSVEKPFECEICSKKFKSKHNLKRHMENHSGIKKKCNYCDKELKNSGTLWKHMKWHTNPKSFKCGNCAKSFVWKQSYTRHITTCKPEGNSNEETVLIEESSFHSKENKEIMEAT